MNLRYQKRIALPWYYQSEDKMRWNRANNVVFYPIFDKVV